MNRVEELRFREYLKEKMTQIRVKNVKILCECYAFESKIKLILSRKSTLSEASFAEKKKYQIRFLKIFYMN